jgi:glycosyltransferase involved in cell wall biosynthesis
MNLFGRMMPHRLHVVTPSKWLAEEVRSSSLMRPFAVSVIPNSLDTGIYAPLDKILARRAFGLPIEARIVLFVSESTTKRRKGFTYLSESLASLTDVPGINIISLGKGIPPAPASIPHFHLGSLENDRLLALAYSAADVFVIPSLQDNLPNTVLESFACGTPVIGFDIGGIPDMVRPRETGLLIPSGDVPALREAIRDLLLNDEKRAALSVNCRKTALTEYSLPIQARRYLSVYQSMLDKQSGLS